MPSVILDISLEKENKKTKPTESEFEIGLLEEEILRMKKIETILSLWFIQEKKSLEEVKTSRSSQHMVNRKPWAMCHRMIQMSLPMGLYRAKKLLETPRVGRLWKVLEMPGEIHTTLHYGGKHERSPGLFREF